jgi:hypothetical protein
MADTGYASPWAWKAPKLRKSKRRGRSAAAADAAAALEEHVSAAVGRRAAGRRWAGGQLLCAVLWARGAPEAGAWLRADEAAAGRTGPPRQDLSTSPPVHLSTSPLKPPTHKPLKTPTHH